jgi:hypothetical protein
MKVSRLATLKGATEASRAARNWPSIEKRLTKRGDTITRAGCIHVHARHVIGERGAKDSRLLLL